METLAKILELASKNSWALFVTAVFLLFVPDDIAKMLALEQFKAAYRGYLWLVLIFTAMIVIGAHLKFALMALRHNVFYPLKKLILPIKDLKSGIKQSRMRYYCVQFQYRDGSVQAAFQGITSNGYVIGYFDLEGVKYFPQEPHECVVLENGKFQFPKWARVDWRDIFTGDGKSGCWGISVR